ncbi:chemotaxis protein CheW [bacterium]|nr:chemotaxis protein CheW [bacterium]
MSVDVFNNQLEKHSQNSVAGIHSESIRNSIEEKSFQYHEQLSQVITLSLNDQHFAINLEILKEIVNTFKITKLPAVTNNFYGVMSLRGQVIGVLNLKSCLGIEPVSYGEHSVVIVIEYEGSMVGLIADSISEILNVQSNQVEKLSEKFSGSQQEYFSGVIKTKQRLYSIIEPEKIVASHIHILHQQESIMTVALQSRQTTDQNQIGETVQLVTFKIHSDEFAVPISEVQEINKVFAVTHVPRAPEFVEGVINLRGQIVPVINLRERFQIEKSPKDKNTRVIITLLEDKRIGLIVDAVSEVVRVPSESIKKAPAETVGSDNGFIQGLVQVGNRLLIVLKLEKVLSLEETADLHNIKQLLISNEMPKEEDHEEQTVSEKNDELQASNPLNEVIDVPVMPEPNKKKKIAVKILRRKKSASNRSRN